MLEPSSLSLSPFLFLSFFPFLSLSFPNWHTHTHTSVTHLISATKLATIFPHVPPENTFLLKLIQNNSVRESAYWHLLYQFNNFITLCLCKGNASKKGCFNTALQPKGTFLSCNILSYLPQISVRNEWIMFCINYAVDNKLQYIVQLY